MKKLIVISVAAGLLLLAIPFTPSLAQPPAQADTPTFYRLVPGTYVNGWPRFTIHYPKDWIEMHPPPLQMFRAAAGPARFPMFTVAVGPHPLPLEKFADIVMPYHKAMGTDMTVVSDKPSKLRDGSPAREIEIHGVENGLPYACFYLVTKKGDQYVPVTMTSQSERVSEDLKAYLYSLESQPGFDEPVKVPADVQVFLDENISAVVAHDLEKAMSYYSDKYLNSGITKGEWGQVLRTYIASVTSLEGAVTDFVRAGDRAYLAGFVTRNGIKEPLSLTSITKEHGQWRWYGNQRDAGAF